jgi:hypothetical protein
MTEADYEINKAWTVLSKGKVRPSERWARIVNPLTYRDPNAVVSLINTLVPFADDLLRAHHIEKLIQLVLRSDLSDRLKAVDPLNTYDKTTLVFPTPGEFVDTDAVNIRFDTVEGAHYTRGEGSILLNCELNPSLETFTTQYGSSAYTITNNLSSSIELLPGFNIRLFGAQPSSTILFNIQYVADLKVDWVALLKNLEATVIPIQDEELRNFWENDPTWINRIAAVTLHTMQHASR